MTNSKDAINAMVRQWYQALDTHEPVETLTAMLDETSLRMVFPEATLEGLSGFTGWYEGVIRIFFDEVHQVKDVTFIREDGDTFDIKVAVHWEASRWKAPAARSERIKLIAYQSWTVRMDARNTPRIATYTVDRLDYLPGSAQL